jgi:aerobic carbon-monoxide dehydrogenase large subunit
MPRVDNLPDLRTELVEVLSPTNPYGIKPGSEGGTTPALTVIVSAMLNALATLGLRDIAMPATPSEVWAAIQCARGKVKHRPGEDKAVELSRKDSAGSGAR